MLLHLTTSIIAVDRQHTIVTYRNNHKWFTTQELNIMDECRVDEQTKSTIDALSTHLQTIKHLGESGELKSKLVKYVTNLTLIDFAGASILTTENITDVGTFNRRTVIHGSTMKGRVKFRNDPKTHVERLQILCDLMEITHDCLN